MSDIAFKPSDIASGFIEFDDSGFRFKSEGSYDVYFGAYTEGVFTSESASINIQAMNNEAYEMNKGNGFLSGEYSLWGTYDEAFFYSDPSFLAINPVSVSRKGDDYLGLGLGRHGGIAFPLGSKLTLLSDMDILPVSIKSDELGVDWELGMPAPVLNIEGEGVLIVRNFFGEEITIPLSVYGPLDSVRLDAGFDVEGAPTVFAGFLNPYKVIGSTISGREIDLSALYYTQDSAVAPDAYLTPEGLYATTPEKLLSLSFLPTFYFDEGFGRSENMGLPSDPLTISIAHQAADTISVSQTNFFLPVGWEAPVLPVSVTYNGRSYEVSLDPFSGQQRDEGIHKFSLTTSTMAALVSNPPSEQIDFRLEVGKETGDSIRGRWQYLDNGETRIIGPYSAETYQQESESLLKVASTGRYLVRAGIPDVSVSAKAEVLGGDPIAGRTLTGIDARKLTTRAIGGGNVIFKNQDTGDSYEVSPDDSGAISTSLPTGDYVVSSQVEITDSNNGSVTYAVFDAPAVVEGSAVDLGTFTAADSGLHNFKSQLITKELVFFGANDGSISYNNSEAVLRITNIGGALVSGLNFAITMEDGIKRTFDWDNVIGDLDVGESMDIPVRFSFNRPDEDSVVTIDVVINDASGNQWNDQAKLTVSKWEPMTLEVHARNGVNSGSANGYVVTPGNKLVKIGLSNTKSEATYQLPKETDKTYRMIFTSVASQAASAYGIGADADVDTTALEAFTNTGKNENPSTGGDNLPENANQLYLGETYMGYAATGDVDYFDLNVTAAP